MHCREPAPVTMYVILSCDVTIYRKW